MSVLHVLRRRRFALIVSFIVLIAAAATSAQAGESDPAQVTAHADLVDAALLDEAIKEARSLRQLHGLIIARNGEIVFEDAFRGPPLDRPVNIKSLSKTIIATLVGMALDREEIDSVHQPIASVLGDRIPANADPRVREITIGHLLAMRAGLESTSGANYGHWIMQKDWVGFALSRPFVSDPGGRMIYSSGNSHILSALLTRATGRDTHSLVEEWLAKPLGIRIPPWQRDRQGIYFGGNNMAVSPRAILRIGELYRQNGVIDGQRILSEEWIEAAWRPQRRSPHSGHLYGYGWFLTQAHGYDIRYGWGYGGQMLYVVPQLGLTVVMTSDLDTPSVGNGYIHQLHALLKDRIIPAVEGANSRHATRGDRAPVHP